MNVLLRAFCIPIPLKNQLHWYGAPPRFLKLPLCPRYPLRFRKFQSFFQRAAPGGFGQNGGACDHLLSIHHDQLLVQAGAHPDLKCRTLLSGQRHLPAECFRLPAVEQQTGLHALMRKQLQGGEKTGVNPGRCNLQTLSGASQKVKDSACPLTAGKGRNLWGQAFCRTETAPAACLWTACSAFGWPER